jgi:hypothetical protein
VPVYLVGMGLIVYLSDFGPLKNPVFPLWWDMVVVAVFNLIIYAWAQRVALPREAIERLIAMEPEASPGYSSRGMTRSASTSSPDRVSG